MRIIYRLAWMCLSPMLAIGQIQVSVSGTVKSSRGSSPIAGAEIRFANLSATAKTDSGGRFSLSTSSVSPEPGGFRRSNPAIDPKSFRFHQTASGPARLRILDVFGKEQTALFSGRIPRGDWEIPVPPLLPGVYFCAHETPWKETVFRFSVTNPPNRVSAGPPAVAHPASGPCPAGVGKRSAADSPVDTLLVTKNGYRAVRMPINAYQLNNLNILMDDTSATNADDANFIPDPSWTCFMPGGIPPPSLGDAVFTITLRIGAIHEVGKTKFGQRRQYDIGAGTVTGARFNATALAGGLDYELRLANGSTEVEQIEILRAESVPILMRNAGVAPAGVKDARIVLDFEAPNSSSYAWLNTGRFAATRIVDTAANTIRLDVFEISKVALPAKSVKITDPIGVPNQTWECFTMTGNQGAAVFTENVTLGASVSIGASKRGSRNIIPITGGTTTGRVVGKILSGGADYQLSGLDARYTLAPNDGEFILVRNCGSGGLVPVFEARVDGPYAFLNENKYLSSSPASGSGGVSITFFEKK